MLPQADGDAFTIGLLGHAYISHSLTWSADQSCRSNIRRDVKHINGNLLPGSVDQPPENRVYVRNESKRLPFRLCRTRLIDSTATLSLHP